MALSVIGSIFKNNNHFLDFNIKCLLYMGLWPSETWSNNQKMLYKIYEYFLHILSMSYLVLTAVGTYNKRHDITIVLSNLDLTIFGYNFFFKTITFITIREKLRVLINQIIYSKDTVSELRGEMMVKIVYFTMIFTSLIIGVFAAMAVYEKKMAVEAWMPFDPLKNQMNLIMSTEILGVGVLPSSFRAFSIQGIVCSIVMYLCEHLMILQKELRSIKHVDDANVREELKWIVKKHIQLMRYAKTLEIIFRDYFLIQNVAVTVEICLNAYMITFIGLEQKMLVANFLACLCLALLNAYVYCYLGNELILQSAGIAQAAYESPWTSWPLNMQKDLLTLMVVAQKPFKITAGGVSVMSIQTFAETLYNGYSIFAVLNDAMK
ncbi:hypothetical protein K1T71_013719 [Dendrolimus kikuchii]|uniref:Uncharacterized protein n=1 Tax=Dendrolimus kikuchii TaxID=765133 RepID=A0ACC1CHN2_9NEOP|nr:hypothetical protein K1T71_013719 [Dendrolimus kikuchii]